MAVISFLDLNSFALYPTMGVGYVTAAARKHGHDVRLVSPLEAGVVFSVREQKQTPLTRLVDHLTFDERPAVRRLKRILSALPRRQLGAKHEATITAAQSALEGTDILMVSTYLEHLPVVRAVAQRAKALRIPVLLGGQAFSQPEITEAWLGIEGVTGIVTGEAEQLIGELLDALARGELPSARPGWAVPGQAEVSPLPPLRDLDELPFPDYSDFPWERYPRPLIPILASRGCAWGACKFCSDVVTTNGRGARFRSVANVLEDMEHQAERHHTRDFLFLDLKLNGSLELWDGLLEEIPKRLPGARWGCAVHVGKERENGLDLERLKAARAAGNIRMTAGLESGSQRVLDAMSKGVRVEDSSAFLRNARLAGLSARATMILSYPGEREEDLAATARFLEAHEHDLDRVAINRFDLQVGTTLHRQVSRSEPGLEGLRITEYDPATGRLRYEQSEHWSAGYRRELRRVVKTGHRINARPLPERALAFEGIF